ncbi:ferrous iron transport protein B [Desulfobacula sp.]|jgi:ferrous iron transport protein B|uniref:ferrous iron transport protein B n=1 Tax=Desulfobacula sp. TaxID=2593537 RepID=UPI001D2DABFA|nr:ferrous iron transport protein B [Desulfobacula sp.]MBT4027518.1 ferrous iron transport protein B [Desulfobacula sp.]MBT4200951.1 ferrous iron transport protein B [Desulfobacula sp.]MBT4508687.1 ferrous iron transport protein B [Desulfobacula sp.]MBT6752008.1 ferrous iron transport protein B [Desulfobacula sp.]
MSTAIVLAGNPNSGKTSLFNELTGGRQHVGNYPGVTVEKKQGTHISDIGQFDIIDLPGTYSLTAYSLEEVVARDFLVNENPSMIVNIVDASNLERNLYLSVQFMEMGIPVCIALNMMDVAKKRGIQIDIEKLSKLLRVPVVPTIARTGKGKEQLMQAVAAKAHQKFEPLKISYGQDIDIALDKMEAIIKSAGFLTSHYRHRWTALKYLENDQQIIEMGHKEDKAIALKLDQIVQKVTRHLGETLDAHPEGIIADQRYGYVNSVLKQGVIKFYHDENRLQISDKIDKVVTNRFLGPVIMVAVLMGLYHFTFTYSTIPAAGLENVSTWIAGIAELTLPDGLLKSLIISGIIDGVGGVLGFVPLIMFMFLGISFLEDTGYLARMAFMLDRVFRMFGLHGSSVMAFIVSGGIAGGCAVPGVMATRTLKSPKERLATLLTVPFMNCGAKLPVFALLVAAFFAEKKALVMILITMISWMGALLVAWGLRSTIIKGESTPFVMELPPYRLPTAKGLLIHTLERTWQYIKKAGTVILAISIVLWAMMTFPGLDEAQLQKFEDKRMAITSGMSSQTLIEESLLQVDLLQAQTALKNSIAGRVGTAVEGLTRFAGFDWRTNIALIGGFAAKEVVVSTLGIAYSLGEVNPDDTTSLSQRLKTEEGWGPLTAFSLILFTIFYSPCFVTVVCIARETGSWKWAAFSIVFNTTLALSLSILFYQVGSVVLA